MTSSEGNISRRTFLTGSLSAGSGLAAAAFLGASEPADAQQRAIKNSADPFAQAGKWSETNPGVAISVWKGTKEEINPNTRQPFTAQEIGDILVRKLDRFGVPAVAFPDEINLIKDGTRVMFLVKGGLVRNADLSSAADPRVLAGVASRAKDCWPELLASSRQRVSQNLAEPQPRN